MKWWFRASINRALLFGVELVVLGLGLLVVIPFFVYCLGVELLAKLGLRRAP